MRIKKVLIDTYPFIAIFSVAALIDFLLQDGGSFSIITESFSDNFIYILFKFGFSSLVVKHCKTLCFMLQYHH